MNLHNDLTSISIKNLSFRYSKNTKKIIDSINLDIKKSQIIGIIGLSGVGKSTLIKILSGIIPMDSNDLITGEIKIFGKIGVVFQNPENQIIFSTVEDELAFGMENLCFPQEKMKSQIDNILRLLDIEDLRYRNPNKLSDGEKQIIIIAANLCMEMDIIIFDEALSFIDQKGRDKILKILELLKEKGHTIIMVEHDYENLSIADCVYQMEDGKLESYKL